MTLENDLTKEELKIIMDCITITDESMSNRVVVVPKEAEKRLENFSLNDLWTRIYNKYKMLKEKEYQDREHYREVIKSES